MSSQVLPLPANRFDLDILTPAEADRPMGVILVDWGRLTQENAQRVLDFQKKAGLPFGEAAIAMGLVTEEDVRQVLEAAAGVRAEFDTLVVLGIGQAALERVAAQQGGGVEAPRFEVDPFWPKTLPNHWVLGQAIGVWVDEQDVVWIIHRSSATLADNEKALELKNGECCAGAPPVLGFDAGLVLADEWRIYMSAGLSLLATEFELSPLDRSDEFLGATPEASGYYAPVKPSRAMGVVPMLAAGGRVANKLYAGAALFSIYSGAGGETELPAYLVAAAAGESRAFPAFCYDPSAASGERFSLAGSPQPAKDWVCHALAFEDAALQRKSEAAAFTFADFVACDGRYAGWFAPVPLSAAAPENVPCILMADRQGVVHRAVVADELAVRPAARSNSGVACDSGFPRKKQL